MTPDHTPTYSPSNSGPATGSQAAGRPRLGVLCLSASLGGLELNSLKFAAWMQARGWDVTLFAPPATPLANLAEQWAVPLAPVVPRRGLQLPPAARALQKQVAQRRITVLIVTQNKDLGLATLVKLLLKGDLYLLYQQHMQLGRAKRDWFHTLRFRLLDAWLSPLPGLARQVLEKTRIAASRVHVVPLGLPIEQFSEAALPQHQARQALNLPAQGPLLGLLGRLDYGKGQDFVLEVLHQLRTTTAHPARLLLMGEPTRNEGDAYFRRLQELVAQWGLQDHVFFRDFEPDPATFYNAIDVFVLASTNETYGMVTLEAMAAGVPIVASAAGGTLELVQDGHTGLLYPLGDVATCVRQIRQCLEQPGLAQQRVQQAQQQVQQYSHQRQCALTEAIIGSLSPAVSAG
ncbi:glycosyltransferase family 4 protein [Hymenobacter elongatus]|uniref:Glycosyltransferase n=1 Tax=Hymenobacter elongatus TaxID=877208 RepID=A0A4Z0PJL8_9BACT|nr:glycosyltransferase family 4 protein [Hymenobacter elongatus]TGE15806.1 glycosyltransferase [Hymenobacter elongatus]